MSSDFFFPAVEAQHLLHQYSEWLDSNRVVFADRSDRRTHDDLVKQFIADRSPHARPRLEVPAGAFERLVDERDDLRVKRDDLQKFIGTDDYNALALEAQSDLVAQVEVMSKYLFILQRRVTMGMR